MSAGRINSQLKNYYPITLIYTILSVDFTETTKTMSARYRNCCCFREKCALP